MRLPFMAAGPLVAATCAFALCGAGCGGSPVEPKPVPSCTFVVTPTTASVPASGGSASFTVTAASGCSWTARADVAWLSIASGASGSGDGVVGVSASANAGTLRRTGTVNIAGQSLSIDQDGIAACTYDIAPTSAALDKDGGTGTFTVTTPAHCQWSPSSTAAWIVVSSGGARTGNGAVSYSVSRNTEIAGRTATITVADKAFAVSQSGDAGGCQYSLAPVEFSPCMSWPNALTSTLTTQQGCSWTATSTDAWITITQGQAGSGSGVVSFRVSDNWDAPRQGVVQVRWPTPTQGQNIHVSQAGCRYAVSPDSFTFVSAGGSGAFDVLQQSDPYTCGGPLQNACTWTARSDVPWLVVTTSMPRAGDDRVSFTVAANDGAAARSGTITVRDKVVRVTQAGR